MTTTSPARVRSRRTRIGPQSVLWALLAALLTALALPTPAYASNFVVQTNPGSVDVTTGQGGQTVEVSLQNSLPKAEKVRATIALEGLDNLADISVDAGDCSGVEGATVNCGSMDAGAKRTFSVTVNPNDSADLAEGDTRNGTLKATMEGPNQGQSSATVNVIGGQTASITGTVANVEDQKPLEGATIKAEYSDGSSDETTSDKDGKYILEDPVDGDVTVTVIADGFAEYEENLSVSPGKESSLTSRLSPEEDDDSDKETQEANVAGKQDDESAAGDVDGTSIVLIILGGLLIVGAIVAIVLLIRKGRAEKNEEEAPESPSTPPIHNPSATQTGRLGVYDSAARPGMDSPTMIHNGPLVRDGERSRPNSEPVSGAYASNEPVSSGFGPAYGSRADQAGSTQRYPSADSGGGWGDNYRDAAVGGYSNAPVSGGYRGNEPVSGSYGYGQHNEPVSGTYRSNEPVSGNYGRGNEPVSGSYGYSQQHNAPVSGNYGYGQHNEPVSGTYRSNEPVSGNYGRGNEPVSGSYGYSQQHNAPVSGSYGRGNEPVSGSYGYSQQHNAPVSGGYRDAYGGQAGHRSQEAAPGPYGYPSDAGYGDGYREQGYQDDYAPRQSRPRRYRDDDNDRPQSW